MTLSKIMQCKEIILMDNTKKFNGYAKDYTSGRPSYSKELIDCFYNEYGVSNNSIIADIGSGTGKFAKHLLERKSEVYCVEPNDDMRRMAEAELGEYSNFHSVNGNAENTTLENGSVDYITTAQAFHWFDVNIFKGECSRILRGKGTVFLIWNVRDDDKLNQELFQIYSGFCPDFKGFSGGMKKDDQRIRDFFDDRYDYVSFDNPLFYDKEKFIARSLSGSYSLKEGDKEYASYIESILDVFDRYSEDGIVSIGHRSVAYIGQINKY